MGKVFENFRPYVTLPTIDTEEANIKFLKEYINSKMSCALFFHNPEITRFFDMTLKLKILLTTYYLLVT